eukprot:2282011-Rhodomonas_salina.1
MVLCGHTLCQYRASRSGLVARVPDISMSVLGIAMSVPDRDSNTRQGGRKRGREGGERERERQAYKQTERD